MKRKILLISFVLSTSIALTACGNQADSENVMATETIESTTETIESTEATQETVQESTQEESLTTEVESTEETVTNETTETTPSTESTETIESEVSNEEVVIDSVADLEEGYQKLRESWERKATWTASNGVTIKINDAWADAIGGGGASAIYFDGTEDLTPDSPFMQACDEYMYGDEAFLNGTDRWNPEVVDVSQLPDIPCASSKQTSVPNSSEFTAYKEAFDYMYGFQVSGKWGANTAYCLQRYGSGSGIGLTAMASGYLWEMNYDGSEWVVTIRSNLSELQHDALHNSLRLVSPDGDALYSAIYEDFYVGMTIPDYNTWYDISALYGGSSSSQIYVPDLRGSGYAEYYFK